MTELALLIKNQNHYFGKPLFHFFFSNLYFVRFDILTDPFFLHSSDLLCYLLFFSFSSVLLFPPFFFYFLFFYYYYFHFLFLPFSRFVTTSSRRGGVVTNACEGKWKEQDSEFFKSFEYL